MAIIGFNRIGGAVRPASISARAISACARGLMYFKYVLIEYRRAKAAERIYEQLRRMDEDTLSRAGLSRRNLATEVKARLELSHPQD